MIKMFERILDQNQVFRMVNTSFTIQMLLILHYKNRCDDFDK